MQNFAYHSKHHNAMYLKQINNTYKPLHMDPQLLYGRLIAE